MSRHTFNPKIAEDVAGRIVASMDGAEMTIADLLRELPPGSPSRSTISRYTHGSNLPSIEALCHLALGLGCEPGDLLPSLADLPKLLGVKRRG